MTSSFQNKGMARRTLRGQTLIIAILVLGVLLIIGFAFASLVSRNIQEAGRAQTRTIASDLAQAGLNFAHYQLTNSSQAADWRPSPTLPDPLPGSPELSRDPDAVYLRQGTGLAVAPDPNNPGITLIDKGGPDYKGAFSREFTDRGRRLIRVRYAPNDLEGFTSGRDSSLRQPGKAKNYITIESVGRSGNLRAGNRIDPTKQLPNAVRVSGFVTPDQLRRTVAETLALDTSFSPDTRKMKAFASVGLIESARFITNKYRSNRPAEIGFPVGSATLNSPTEGTGVGATFPSSTGPVSVEVVQNFGRIFAEPLSGRSTGFSSVPGGGSLYSNADVLIHGTIRASMNAFLGENWLVNGSIRTANERSQMLLTRTRFDAGTDQWISSMQGSDANGNPYNIASTVSTPFVMDLNRLESDRPTFSTGLGSVRDGREGSDTEGFTRGVPRKEPPSMLALDPQTRRNRYYEMTRNSGRAVGGRSIGRLGYGEGVYVNAADRGNLDTEDERRQQGAVRNLPSDWLNPNNTGSLGWQGPYYVPVASFVQLLPDGFEIIRDSRSRQRYWRNADGSSSTNSRCRFRLRNIGGTVYILNSILAPNLASAPSASISDADFIQNGEAFNGVLYFEGDVRLRGVIPTDIQLTLVTMGSAYIEGSITKGRVTDSGPITRPSRSMLMIMARDYAVLNTTMFFGPVSGQSTAVKTGQPIVETPSPIELDPSDISSVILNTEFLSGPEVTGGVVNNPSTWRSYANSYESGAFGANPHLLLSAASDDNGPSFVATDTLPVSFANPTGAIFRTLPIPRNVGFGTAGSLEFNAASAWLPGVDPNIALYGLGDPSVNAYPKFETIGFPLLDGSTTETSTFVDSFASYGGLRLALDDPTLMRVRLNPIGTAATKNFLLAKAAVVPHDIKIEASLFAEEGSFFVIPGSWFNTNPEDSRVNYNADLNTMTADRANLRRFQQFGSSPIAPFYGEPLDVKIRIIGSVSENMPAPMSQQAQWLQKWGWIPTQLGGSNRSIPVNHLEGFPVSAQYVPNLSISYDPALAFASSDGVNPIRVNADGWILPPMPRLPVSPTLAYFGDANP